MDSPSTKFKVACGPVSKEEQEYLLAKGLKFENSSGELMDVSTDVEDVSYSSLLSRSQQESLMVFEANEKLFAELSHANDEIKDKHHEEAPVNKSPMRASNSSIFTRSQIHCMEAIEELGLDEDLDDENKENQEVPEERRLEVEEQIKESARDGESGPKFFNKSTSFVRMSTSSNNGKVQQSLSFSGSLRSPGIQSEQMSPTQERSLVLTERKIDIDHESADEECEGPMNDSIELVPCTQNVPADCDRTDSVNASLEVIPPTPRTGGWGLTDESMNESLELVPCTQAPVEETADLNESLELVPCTQSPVEENPKLNESLGLVPCTQAPTVENLNKMDESLDLVLCTQVPADENLNGMDESLDLVPCTQAPTDENLDQMNESLAMVSCTQIPEEVNGYAVNGYQESEHSSLIKFTPAKERNSSLIKFTPIKDRHSALIKFTPINDQAEPLNGLNEDSNISNSTQKISIRGLFGNDSTNEGPVQEVQEEVASPEQEDLSFMESLKIVPFAENISAQEHNASGAVENMEAVTCPQPLQQTTDAEDSQFDVSSRPCTQESVGLSGSSKEDMDDTLTLMTKLLELADEQEAKEKAAEETKQQGLLENEESLDQNQPGQCDANESSQNESGEINEKENKEPEELLFKTPLKHTRVTLLKNKKLCTPSPPRSYVDSLLKREVVRKTEVINKPVTPKKLQPEVPSRTPLANITPAKPKRVHTRTSTPSSAFKTPVASKVDSGLHGKSPFPVGLSPVANYIYAKPAPSTFARVQGIPTQKANTSTASNSSFSNKNKSVTRIPIPPSRMSQAQIPTKTPNSASKEPRRVGPLRTSTFFDTSCTPPKIVSNEVVDTNTKKRFQQLQYTGSSKVKVINGGVESPKATFVAQRHTGLRDESGNASFIQSSLVQKMNVPRSRLVTPKSIKNK